MSDGAVVSDVIELEKIVEPLRDSLAQTLFVRLKHDRAMLGDGPFTQQLTTTDYCYAVARELARNSAQAIADVPLAAVAGSVVTSVHDAWLESVRQQAMRLSETDTAHLRNDAMAFAQQSAMLLEELKRACDARDAMLATAAAQTAALRALLRDAEERAKFGAHPGGSTAR